MHKEKAGLSWIIAAGIVGADIGTSIFYSTGILFPYVGYLAPLFILFVCLMMWLFKMTYQEGIALSPYNGGAYVMVLRSVGRRAAVLVGSLTILSYLATAAVSSVSGAFYISSLADTPVSDFNKSLIAFIPIILFGLLNARGIKEPAKLVTGIASTHFFLLIIMALWSIIYLLTHDIEWSKMSTHMPAELTTGALLHGFGAAFLGITGFESAAQIVEELESPVHETVRKLYKTVVILVSLTAPVISFMCLAILTNEEVIQNKEFLLSALAFKLGGSILMVILVVDATLTLFAATNTAYVGFIGLATTMAKQGNLPQFLLKRLAHKFPSIQGYPLIAMPFMLISMCMVLVIPGAVDILKIRLDNLAKVYEISFLGVMVSFAVGAILMRNRKYRKDIAKTSLTKLIVRIGKYKIPLIPAFSSITLLLAQVILILFASGQARGLWIEMLSLILLVMSFYRWGVLERRLETRHDLRLGMGRYANTTDLPNDLPKVVLCAGGTGARRLINAAMKKSISVYEHEPFEMIVFHAEENKDPKGFFFELLQRVVSQQIAPIYSEYNFVLTVKILPGNLIEGLQTLKKTSPFEKVLLGYGQSKIPVQKISEEIAHEIESEVELIQM